MKKTAGVPWKKVRQQLVREDPDFAAAFEELAPEYEIARQLIRARAKCCSASREHVRGTEPG